MKGATDNTQMVLGFLVVVILGAAVLYLGPNFETMLSNLQGAGFFSYLLPFVLVFVLVYWVLKSTKTVDNMTAMVLGLVVALFSMLFLSTVPVVAFLAYFLGRMGILIIILVVLYMFYAFMSKGEEKKK
jgi:phosphatidylserine synthase